MTKRAIEMNHIEIVRLLLDQTKVNLILLDKFQRDCLNLALKNKNDLIADMLKQKLDEYKNLSEASSKEFENLEQKFESSSLKTSLNEEQSINSLNDFYKKKSFTKTLTSKSQSSFTNFSNDTLATSASPRPITSNKQPRSSQTKNWEFILQEEDSTSSSNEDSFVNDEKEEAAGCFPDGEIKSSTKKKRLSMSPLNKIEDTLYWLKQNNQSKKSSDGDNLEKKEFSLTGRFRIILKGPYITMV